MKHNCDVCGCKTFKTYASVEVTFEANAEGKMVEISASIPEFSGDPMQCIECNEFHEYEEFVYHMGGAPPKVVQQEQVDVKRPKILKEKLYGLLE